MEAITARLENHTHIQSIQVSAVCISMRVSEFTHKSRLRESVCRASKEGGGKSLEARREGGEETEQQWRGFTGNRWLNRSSLPHLGHGWRRSVLGAEDARVRVRDATHTGSITRVLKPLQPRITVVLYGESSQLVCGSALSYYASFCIIVKSFGCYFKSAIVIK